MVSIDSMVTLDINTITGLTQPYDVHICNVFEQNCVFVATINTSVVSPITIPLPSEFSTAPVIGVKITTSDGCSRFKLIYC